MIYIYTFKYLKFIICNLNFMTFKDNKILFLVGEYKKIRNLDFVSLISILGNNIN